MENKFKAKVVTAPHHQFEQELNATIDSIGGKFVDIQYHTFNFDGIQIYTAFVIYVDHQENEVLH